MCCYRAVSVLYFSNKKQIKLLLESYGYTIKYTLLFHPILWCAVQTGSQLLAMNEEISISAMHILHLSLTFSSPKQSEHSTVICYKSDDFNYMPLTDMIKHLWLLKSNFLSHGGVQAKLAQYAHAFLVFFLNNITHSDSTGVVCIALAYQSDPVLFWHKSGAVWYW